MADRDRAAVHVQPGLVQPQRARAGHRLGGERLVDLDPVDGVEPQADPFQQRIDRRHRADAHHLRRAADRDAGDQAGERPGA